MQHICYYPIFESVLTAGSIEQRAQTALWGTSVRPIVHLEGLQPFTLPHAPSIAVEDQKLLEA